MKPTAHDLVDALEPCSGRIAAEEPLVRVEDQLFAARVRRGILRLAPRRVRHLSVEVIGQVIVMRGRCGSYYGKQLAQHAAMELADGRRIDNQLVVD